MSRESDRDRALETLLRQSIGDPSAPPTSACLDGEALAAWSSGRLPTAEAAIMEQHVAGCARCLAAVAAFARATPQVAVPQAWRQRWQVRWLVPLATAATVAAIWVALPPQAPLDQARLRDAAPAASSAPPPQPPPAPAREQAKSADQSAALRNQEAPRPNADESLRRDRPSSAATGARANRRAEADADAPAAKEEEPRALQEKVAVAPPAAQVAPSVAPESQERRARDEAMQSEAKAKQRETGNLTAISPMPAERASPEILGSALKKPAASAFEDARSSGRWRIAGGRVERQSSTGARWQPAPITMPDEALALSAPEDSVVWVVGRRGLVYLSTDGSRFARVSFPHAVELVAVKATDARQAIVTTVDGRAFRTTDAGRTWTPVAP